MTVTYDRWVIIYNANLDRAPHLRLTIADLREDLRKWEEGRKKKGNAKDIDPIAYQVSLLVALLL
jgi:hypothetical protein